MFQTLRVGTPLYVLHKAEPKIEIAEVVSVSNVQPQFATTYQSGVAFNNQRMIVDIKAKVGDTTIDLQQLPAEQTIADFGNNGMVISESKEAILNEIELLRKKSASVIQSVDFHKKVLAQCTAMAAELNPTARQEAEQKREIERMKTELSGLRDDMVDIKGMLAKALNKKTRRIKLWAGKFCEKGTSITR